MGRDDTKPLLLRPLTVSMVINTFYWNNLALECCTPVTPSQVCRTEHDCQVTCEMCSDMCDGPQGLVIRERHFQRLCITLSGGGSTDLGTTTTTTVMADQQATRVLPKGPKSLLSQLQTYVDLLRQNSEQLRLDCYIQYHRRLSESVANVPPNIANCWPDVHATAFFSGDHGMLVNTFLVNPLCSPCPNCFRFR